MATKLSAVSQKTGTNADDLLYLASTSDNGSTYESKAIKISNLFSSVASGTDLGTFTGDIISDNTSVQGALQELETALETETTDRAAAITAAIDALVDSAPGTLDTLNEIAAAINDDANAFTTLSSSIAAVQADVDQNESDGDAADAALSARITTLEADPTTATALAAVQADVDQNESDADAAIATINALITALQADVDGNEADADAAIAANELHIDNAATLSGLAKDSTDLGAFSGSTIANGVTIKAALQALETALEALDTKTVDGGDNVNTLVASTTPDTTPATFYFLGVDAATGAIKVIEKDFVEVE